jgi:glutathione S-transferase
LAAPERTDALPRFKLRRAGLWSARLLFSRTGLHLRPTRLWRSYFQETFMKLYYTPGACSLSPHIIAQEAGIPIELEKVDLKTHKTASGEDFYQVNPKGYVPALRLDDGSLLTEGPAIDTYLADQKPDSGLMPSGNDRYKTLSWLAFINSELHKTFGPLFANPSEDAKKEITAKLSKRFDYVNQQLAGHDYLMGKTFTVADAYLFVMLTWSHHLKIDLSSFHNLTAFFARVAQRPKVHQAMKDEGLVK